MKLAILITMELLLICDILEKQLLYNLYVLSLHHLQIESKRRKR
jgi:hypothetical protein